MSQTAQLSFGANHTMEPTRRRARLYCVAYVSPENRRVLDRLTAEQGQCWTGGSGCSGQQAPLIQYDFRASSDKLRAMDRALNAILEAMDVKYFTFVVPDAESRVR